MTTTTTTPTPWQALTPAERDAAIIRFLGAPGAAQAAIEHKLRAARLARKKAQAAHAKKGKRR